jgi:hypothetical protein
VLADQIGQRRDIDKLGIAQQVTVQGVAREHVAFAPYDDRRFLFNIYDGTLGLDFFQPYDVAVNWHTTKLYLTPRSPTVALGDRLARWGFPQCTDIGCVQLSLSSSAESPKPTVRLVRDHALQGDLAVIVQATGATGNPLPSFEASFPAGVDSLSAELDSMYTGAKLQIADASPFPRKCTDSRGCIVIEQATPP